jgi:hypothetical protein
MSVCEPPAASALRIDDYPGPQKPGQAGTRHVVDVAGGPLSCPPRRGS